MSTAQPSPLVSVVLPTYNGAKYLGEALKSLQMQTFSDFEIIVIVDGSTDNTIELLRAWSDARVRVVARADNLGVATSINHGLSLARGDLIARLDDDDLCHPERLERQVHFLNRHNDIHIVGSAVELIGGETGVEVLHSDDSWIKAAMLQGSGFIASSASMFRRAFVTDNQIKADPRLIACEDLGFWVDCIEAGAQFSNLAEPLIKIRCHAQNTSSRTDPGLRRASVNTVRRRIMGLYWPTLTNEQISAALLLWNNKALDLVALERAAATVSRCVQSPQQDWGQYHARTNEILMVLLRIAVTCASLAGEYGAMDATGMIGRYPELAPFLVPELNNRGDKVYR